MYRNIVRAEGYIATSLGIYHRPTDAERAEMTDEEKVIDDQAEQEQAIRVLADMQLTAEQMKVCKVSSFDDALVPGICIFRGRFPTRTPAS